MYTGAGNGDKKPQKMGFPKICCWLNLNICSVFKKEVAMGNGEKTLTNCCWLNLAQIEYLENV